MMRLESVSKELADRLRKSSANQQREAVLVACAMALEGASVNDPDVLIALKELRVNGVISNNRLRMISKAVSELDEMYLGCQDRADVDFNGKDESMFFFSQARAIAALSFAGKELTLESTMEAIYEASSAFDNANVFFEKILFIL